MAWHSETLDPKALPALPRGIGLESVATRRIVRLLLFFVPIVLAAPWFGAHIAEHGTICFPMDDPFIHFQYARNLATGQGFSFNPGEPSSGATSPLWIVVLAAGHALHVPMEPLAVALGVAFAGLIGLLTFEVGLGAGLAMPLAALAGIAASASGRMTWGALSGMEISLATMLFLLLVRVMQSGMRGPSRAAVIGLVAGLAATSRPEMAVLGPLAVLLEGTTLRAEHPERRIPWARLALTVAVFAATLAPYVVFCLATDGRPLPNTYYAKSFLGRISDPNLTLKRLAYLPGMWLVALRDNWSFALLLVPGLVLFCRKALFSRSGLLALWPLAFWVYAVYAYPRHYSLSRYSIPLVPAMALLSMFAVGWILHRSRTMVGRTGVLAAVTILVLAGAAASQIGYRPVYLANVDNIFRMQVQMARWVAAHTPPGARIAANDVGAITYYSQRYCIDTCGLVTSRFTTLMIEWWRTRRRAYPEEILPGFFRELRPDYAIVFPSWYPNLTRSPWLKYVGEIDYPNNTGGGNELVVFRVVGTPQDLPPPPGLTR